VGDLLFASTTTALSKLADVATGNALISGGVGVAPSYGKIGLTTHVSGTLPVANGGTGITSLGAGVATFLGTPSSANLAAAVTNETGSGALVFATSPTLVTPALGTPSSGTLTNCTFPTLNQNTTGTAAVSTAATVTTSTTASAFKVPFANTTASTTGNYGLLQDSTATFTYNPSTNTLVAGTFSGALSGNATTATTATNATNIAIAADTASAGTFFVPYVSATTGNVEAKGTRLTVQPSTGNFTAAGTVTANSDERLKTDWANLPADFLERLAGVKSGTYTRLDTGARQAGSSAQDWQKLLPEVVTIGDDEQATLSLGYGNAALVAAVELAKVVIELKAELQSLKAKLKE
jgi:hypothetical protein